MMDPFRRTGVISRVSPDQGGFSLLEAMIAMTILAIGLLGLASMQTMALTRNIDSGELGVAVNLAAAMIERIHYNRDNVVTYGGIDTAVGATQPPAAQPTARGDYTQWQNDLATSGLFGAQGTVTVTNPFGPAALNQSQVQVIVFWTTQGQGMGDQVRKVQRAVNVTLQTVVTPL